jgi:exodeoxyribonuclease-3
MKIIAWNVNGLKSLLKTDYLDNMIKDENPDVFCMGETKLSCPYDDIEKQIIIRFPHFKYRYWSPCKTRGGYSGTSIFCKKEPLSVQYGLKYKDKEIDEEGRVIVIEYKKYYILHVYTPNSGQSLNRLEWRTTVWDRAFENYINNLQKTKPIIICGDLNVAHQEIDLKNPKTNLKTAGYTVEERESFNKILYNCNLIDSYRKLNPDKIEYSFWSYMRNSREKNIGWRIDYFLLSKSLEKKIKESFILSKILGSDHVPIKIKI